MYSFDFKLRSAKELDPNGGLMFLTISLTKSSNKGLKYLVKLVLEDIEQLDWFEVNKDNIIKKQCPIDFMNSSSIAEGIRIFYEHADCDNDDELEEIFDFRSKHALRSAFKGQDIPDIFIAANNYGHEISCADNDTVFKYDVDIDSLFSEVSKIKNEYVVNRTTL